MVRHLTVIVLFLSLTATAETELPAMLMEGEVSDDGATTLPAHGWQFVTMPHITPLANPEPRSLWYRFSVDDYKPASAPDSPPQGLLLWRYSMNVKAWLNNEYIGGAGSFEDPITRNWNWPQLFVLPKGAWREEGNEVVLQLAAYPGWGHLAPPAIGDYETLHRSFEARMLRQVTSNQITAHLCLFAALIAFTLFFIDRREPAYGIFGLMSLSWTLYCYSNFVQHSPVSAKIWWWVVHVNLIIFTALLALFARRLAGVRAGKVEWLLACHVLAAALVFGALPLHKIGEYNASIHVLTVSVSFSTLVFSLYHSVRFFRIEMAVLSFCLALVFAFAIHDLWMQSVADFTVWLDGFFVLQFAVPILMVSMLVVLSRKFALSLLAKVDAEHRIRLARERIFADIHDDIGSKLLSLIYVAETESQADLAREALRETRAVITGAVAAEEDLESVLQNAESEAQERCEQAEILLSWVNDGLLRPNTTDEFRYNLQRILRELVSNAIKHGQPQQIEVLVTLANETLSIAVQDDGKGIDADTAAGTGMTSIERRCRELNGGVLWKEMSPGCLASVHLPLRNMAS